jgi:hypothetical protein
VFGGKKNFDFYPVTLQFPKLSDATRTGAPPKIDEE